MANQQVGSWGETLAAHYLVSRGYMILERNARTPYGELDLVARQVPASTVIFVEVKTRRSASLGLPEISVSARKQAHLVAAAQAYMQAHPELGETWRIDVLAIRRLPRKQPEIVHFENAVS